MLKPVELISFHSQMLLVIHVIIIIVSLSYGKIKVCVVLKYKIFCDFLNIVFI